MAACPMISHYLDALDRVAFDKIRLSLEATYGALATGLIDTPIYYMRTPELAVEIEGIMDEKEVRLEDSFDQIVWEALLEIKIERPSTPPSA